MCCSFMISTAARCSLVCGCGHVSLAAISSSAPSITAAPFSMVAMRMSCPARARAACSRKAHAGACLHEAHAGACLHEAHAGACRWPPEPRLPTPGTTSNSRHTAQNR